MRKVLALVATLFVTSGFASLTQEQLFKSYLQLALQQAPNNDTQLGNNTQPSNDTQQNQTDPLPVVHKTILFNLLADFTLQLTVGNPKVDIRLMPAFHTHRTFITSNECLKCKYQNYNPILSNTSVPGTSGPIPNIEYVFDHYGKTNTGFVVTGDPLQDQMCLYDQDPVHKNRTYYCTEDGHPVEFFSVWDFNHDQNLSFFDEMPYDGLLGLGHPNNDIEERQSFTRYLYDHGNITNHTLTLRHTGDKVKQIEFGHFNHPSPLVRYHIEQVHGNMSTMRFDVNQVLMGNYSFPTHLGTNSSNNFTNPEDPHWMRVNLILGSDPFIQFMTPFESDLDEFDAYMFHTFPEIKFYETKNRYNHTVVFGTTKKRTCSQFTSASPLHNFTFNTSHEHQFHIPASSMLFDTHFGIQLGECLFSLLMVYDPGFTQKALMLGDPFFKNFNLSIDYDQRIMGLQGYKTEAAHPAPPTPPPVDPSQNQTDPNQNTTDPTDPTKPDDDPSKDPENNKGEDDEKIDDIEEEFNTNPEPSENAFLTALLMALGSISVLMAATVWCMKRRQDRLETQLNQYNQMEGLGTHNRGGLGSTSSRR